MLLSLCDTQCTNSEVDDRRYVFEVTNRAESMFLQAESAVAQDEVGNEWWIEVLLFWMYMCTSFECVYCFYFSG